MSLLDRPPHTVLVFPEVDGTDGYGTPTRVPAADPVTVQGWVRPVSAAESEQLGQQLATVYRLTARTIPGGAWARVAWDGRDWDPLGEPLKHESGGVTSLDHMTVLLKSRGPAAVV